MNTNWNPLLPEEDCDIFIPTRSRGVPKIEVLSGPNYTADEDVEYFRKKLWGVLKVPKDFTPIAESKPVSLLAPDCVPCGGDGGKHKIGCPVVMGKK